MAKLKKIGNILSTVVVAAVVLCAVFLMGSRLLGYRVYTVISGSMEPEYSVGDLLYVKEADVNTIRVNDPITFILNEDLVVATHRVIRVPAGKQVQVAFVGEWGSCSKEPILEESGVVEPFAANQVVAEGNTVTTITTTTTAATTTAVTTTTTAAETTTTTTATTETTTAPAADEDTP